MAELILQQFAREPVPGKVKTRLLPALSAQQACDLHIALVRRTTAALVRSGLGRVELWVAGDVEAPAFRQCVELGAACVRQQCDGDLGQRMWQALEDGVSRGGAVLLVGSDCPDLDSDYLCRAAEALAGADLVLAPAADGGYALIGVAARPPRPLFENIPWGGGEVLGQTLSRVEELRMRAVLLPEVRDIDRPEDLAYWEAVKAGEGATPPARGGDHGSGAA